MELSCPNYPWLIIIKLAAHFTVWAQATMPSSDTPKAGKPTNFAWVVTLEQAQQQQNILYHLKFNGVWWDSYNITIVTGQVGFNF